MSKKRKPSFSLVGLIALAAIWGGIVVAGVIVYYGIELPRLIDAAAMTRRPSITIRAENGSIIARYGDITGATINVKKLPPHVPEAVLAIEDRRFYSHFGIDPIGILRAMFVNVFERRMAQGASTITQQLARNMFLSPEKKFKRKIQEALLAVWLEWRFTKDEILSGYLNRVYFGAGAYGIDAAARIYFNKSARELTLHEAAMLAGMLKAPTRYSPVSSPNQAESRAQVVLAAMADAGFISDDDLKRQKAGAPAPRRKPGTGTARNDFGRYYTDWIVDQVEDYVGADHGDIEVQTTFRREAQQAAETSLAAVLDKEGPTKNISQGAAVVMSPDGAVRAIVGGRDWQDSQFNRATQALRQPGSSFKPVIYLTALMNGYTPDTEVTDEPIEIGSYSPDNFTGEYLGIIPLREALAKSLNSVSVRLLQEEGIPTAQATARRLGLPAPSDAGLSYALGTSEVTPLQLTAAYASFANGGEAVRPYAILMVRKSDGQLLYRRQSTGLGQVAPPHAVAMLVDMMRDVVTYGTGAGANLGDRPMAGKTGTSQDHRDAWFMGFTADYVTGVWMGNDDNKSMKKVTGGGAPARAWKMMMADIESGLPARELLALVNGGATNYTPADDPLAEAGLRPAGQPQQDPAGFGQLIDNILGN